MLKDRLREVKQRPLEEKVERSLNVLRKVVGEKDRQKSLLNYAKNKADGGVPLIINFSGGKDSCCMLILAKMITSNIECCYVDGGFELPSTLAYVKEQCRRFRVKLVIPKAGEVEIAHRTLPKTCQTFKDFVLHYRYFPTIGKRWCSIWLKQRVMKAYWRSRFS